MIKIVKIPLTQGKVAIIDAEDAPRVLRYKWRAHNKGKNDRLWYAIAHIRKGGGKRTLLWMHRLILQLPPRIETATG